MPVTGSVAQDESSQSPPGVAHTAVAFVPQPAAQDPDPGASTNAPAQQDPPPLNVRLSPWTSEIVKLARAGIADDVVFAFIDNTSGTFNLGADQVIYLNDQGVAAQFISEMMQHDSELALGVRPVTASVVPESGPAIRFTRVSAGDSAGKGIGQRATSSDVSILASVDTAQDAGPEALSERDSLSPMVEEMQSDQALSPEQAEPAAAGPVYLVREPYPVEITGPILVVQGWSRTPNTIIIEYSR
jgi:hypothetical protein